MNKTNTPHFLLVGHDGCHNRGCEALVRTTVSILREEFPNAQFTVAVMYPEHEGPLTDIPGLKIIPGYNTVAHLLVSNSSGDTLRSRLLRKVKNWLPYGLVTGKSLFTRKAKMVLRPQLRPENERGFLHVSHLKNIMLNSDAVISIGGDIFNEDYGANIFYAMEPVEYAQFLGRKTIIFGASIWEVKTRWLEDRMREMFKRTDLITVRDKETQSYLRSIGINKNVVHVADGAFLMPAKSSERTLLPWPTCENKIIGFNGSDQIKDYLPQSKCQQVSTDFIKFFQSLVDQHGCKVVFIPHDCLPGAHERDFLFALEQMIQRPGDVFLLPVGLDAPETKDVIRQCHAFIAMRFHSSVAALSQCIPTLGMSHSKKFPSLHRFVYGHTEYLINYEDISFNLLLEKLKKLLDNREEIQRKLKERIPKIQEQARMGGKFVKDVLLKNIKTEI